MRKVSFLMLPLVASLSIMGCDNAPKKTSTDTAEKTATITAPNLTIGYSDYPGWVAWQIAIEKGWFKEAGLNVDFKWFDYSASLNAFAANQIDAVTIAHGDNLISASSGGTQGILVLATDQGAANDVIVAKAGINSIADLKGKTVATEKGLVDHLLLDAALTETNLKADDIKILNGLTNELPQVFTSSDVDAVALWQPSANQALKNVSGSKIIYTAADKPGVIYGAMAVNAENLMKNKAEWQKVLKIWDKVVNYIEDPATNADAIRIMSQRAGISAEEYKPFVDGTKFLDIQDNKTVFTKGTGFDSIYGSSYNVNEFNVKYGLYPEKIDVDALIGADVVQGIQ